MTFQTFHFLVFFLAVFVLNTALARHFTARRLMLVAANYYFYMCWDVRFAVVLAGITCVNYLCAQRIEVAGAQPARKFWVWSAVAGSLGVLAYFKYANFFLDSTYALAHALGMPINQPLLRIVQPVGLSFFTFQALTYTLDVYRRQCPPTRSLLDYALFVSFFPTLLSGPITRARDFLGQLARMRGGGLPDVRADEGLVLVLRGLIKKVVFADMIALHLVNPAFQNPANYSPLFLMLALYGYTVQIYMDLSGYTDIARGIAKMLGFELPRNFDRPYLAPTISNFWQRWHISMSSFFRDYLFFSLGGSREGNVYRNLMITFVAIGAWHGAGWNFIVYGFLHGALVCWERTQRNRRGTEVALHGIHLFAAIVMTFHFVVLTRLLFRADSLSSAANYVQAMLSGTGSSDPWYVGAVGALIVGALLHLVPSQSSEALVRRVASWPSWVLGGLVVATVLSLLALSMGEAPFIYFEF
nr:MBOAT family O-acyltransferase [Variovorax boronicumulans]